MDVFLATLFIIICLLLIVVVLLQKGRGGGLGAAFGGGAGSAFGARTGDVFTWVTIVLTGLFLLLAIFTTMQFRPAPGRTPRPGFYPPPGEIEDDAFVTIRVAGDRGNTEVYYTTDGSQPSKEAERYHRVAVPVSPGTTLKAIAYRPGAEPSPIASGFYKRKEEPAPAVGDANLPATWPADANMPDTWPADANAPDANVPPAPQTAPATAPAG
jgi:preprotein translocase subunit SecG